MIAAVLVRFASPAEEPAFHRRPAVNAFIHPAGLPISQDRPSCGVGLTFKVRNPLGDAEVGVSTC